MKNIIIYTHMPHFCFEDGGTVVEHFLAKVLDEEFNQNVRIYSSSGIEINNSIFSKFYKNDFPIIDDNTVVIYCEGTLGNPLNAKNVVRWMLSKLGQNVPYDNVYTWGRNELVYYFNSEEKIANQPDLLGNIYKLLNIIFINPDIRNYGLNRDGYCFTIRKMFAIHKNPVIFEHPVGSFEINHSHTQAEYIRIFNRYKYFVSYDSITFLSIIAALCGCVSIIAKVDGLSKEDWINTTVAADYFKYSGEKILYGIAYGFEDIVNAENTIHLVKDQWTRITQFSRDKYIASFINDINNWDNNVNTLENNFFK
jgi:hypothetical protein